MNSRLVPAKSGSTLSKRRHVIRSSRRRPGPIIPVDVFRTVGSEFLLQKLVVLGPGLRRDDEKPRVVAEVVRTAAPLRETIMLQGVNARIKPS